MKLCNNLYSVSCMGEWNGTIIWNHFKMRIFLKHIKAKLLWSSSSVILYIHYSSSIASWYELSVHKCNIFTLL